MVWFWWSSGLLLALLWFLSVAQSALHFAEIADITQPQWEPPQGVALPSVTVIVPARNEEAEIRPALQSLLYLKHENLNVIAVNDRSTDRTSEIMEEVAAEASPHKLRVLHVEELPPGWLGKTHAMWLAAQQATGEWLLFTDADCVFHPDTVRRALHYAITNSLDHLVIFPTAHLQTWGERMMLSFPALIFNFGFHRRWKFKDPKAKDHIGIGAFNLIRRRAYDAIGGHEALRLEVADDLKLGEAVKRAGLRQDMVFGPNMICLRWAVGAAGVIRNLEKNLFAYLRFRLSRVMVACLGVFFLCVWPFLGLMLAPGWTKIGFAFAVAMIAVAYYEVSRYIKVPPLLFLLCPISAVLFMSAALRSAFVVLRNGGVTWRGTGYSLEELRQGSEAASKSTNKSHVHSSPQ
jgi:cellulose synthase/poly-beta-1,6-N-acetylglucosamine synthase-like glycosyltransferase